MMCLAQDSLSQLIQEGNFIPFIAIVGGCTIAVVAVVFGGVRSIAVNRAREQTKREIAAYVAEGSVSPDQAVALINAGRDASDAKA